LLLTVHLLLERTIASIGIITVQEPVLLKPTMIQRLQPADIANTQPEHAPAVRIILIKLLVVELMLDVLEEHVTRITVMDITGHSKRPIVMVQE